MWGFRRRSKQDASLLRIDQGTIRSNRYRCLKCKCVLAYLHSFNIGTGMTCKQLAIAVPIAVKPQLPMSTGREANGVLTLDFISKIGNDNNVIRRPPLIPPVESKNFSLLVKVIDLGELTAKSARATGQIKA